MQTGNLGTAPSVKVNPPAPVRAINGDALRALGAKYMKLFGQFRVERQPLERQWMRNLRQYRGVYDPDVAEQIAKGRSRAYPRVTRVKCVSLLSRIMNLIFPGDETNWDLTASPSPEMAPDKVAAAVSELIEKRKNSGGDPALTQGLVDEAVRAFAEKQAGAMRTLIEDQMRELGGDQSSDWVALNRAVVSSGIRYGMGFLEGPFVRTVQQSGWVLVAPQTDRLEGTVTPGGFQMQDRKVYKPMYEFLPVWDCYPDMTARTVPGEGYFVRKVMSKSKVRKLADREDFFADQVKTLLRETPDGNHKELEWETDLRAMGDAKQTNVTSKPAGRTRYDVIVWRGPVPATDLREAGVAVPEDKIADDVEAELWLCEGVVIKAEINAWRTLGIEVAQLHAFVFDADDTGPAGEGLPQIVRDSQLAVCATTRMTLDNASVTCGPNLEVNTSLLRPDQDMTNIEAHKIWYRDDEQQTAQFPAVRPIMIDGHISELQSLVQMFMSFADVETFIGPATGGDMQRMPSEPMRTAAGASMLRGDAALPFKDIIRNFDAFTQSVISSLVKFNKKFNADTVEQGDYNVSTGGATSLVAKEVRGAQLDALSQTMTPEDTDHVDRRRFVEARFAARDLQGMLVSPEQAEQNRKERLAQMAQAQQTQDALVQAQTQKTKADAFKSITQGQKNASTADLTAVKSARDLMEGTVNGRENAPEGSGGASAPASPYGRPGGQGGG